MPSKNRQQTIGKRNRERAVEEKRRLKRERKEAERAERAAAIEAGLPPPDLAAERAAAREAEHVARNPELAIEDQPPSPPSPDSSPPE
jgi:alkylhydroperoxidase family enzyme